MSETKAGPGFQVSVQLGTVTVHTPPARPNRMRAWLWRAAELIARIAATEGVREILDRLAGMLGQISRVRTAVR